MTKLRGIGKMGILICNDAWSVFADMIHTGILTFEAFGQPEEKK